MVAIEFSEGDLILYDSGPNALFIFRREFLAIIENPDPLLGPIKVTGLHDGEPHHVHPGLCKLIIKGCRQFFPGLLPPVVTEDDIMGRMGLTDDGAIKDPGLLREAGIVSSR